MLGFLDLIRLGCNDDWLETLMNNPLVHLNVIGRRLMSDIYEQEYSKELFGCMKIIFNHLAPLFFNFLGNSGKAISREVYQIEFVVNIVVVDCLSLAGFLGCSGIVLAVHDAVDQRTLADITLSGKSKFRVDVIWKSAGYSTYCF